MGSFLNGILAGILFRRKEKSASLSACGLRLESSLGAVWSWGVEIGRALLELPLCLPVEGWFQAHSFSGDLVS